MESASSSPRALTPARSIALKTYVLMFARSLGRGAAESSVSAPSRRPSSSGVDERASASLRVILPWRTSVASEASIVCMPVAELVCSTE